MPRRFRCSAENTHYTVYGRSANTISRTCPGAPAAPRCRSFGPRAYLTLPASPPLQAVCRRYVLTSLREEFLLGLYALHSSRAFLRPHASTLIFCSFFTSDIEYKRATPSITPMVRRKTLVPARAIRASSRDSHEIFVSYPSIVLNLTPDIDDEADSRVRFPPFLENSILLNFPL